MDSKRECFCKVFIPESSSERLRIPPAYIPKKQGQLPEKVFLRDSYKNMWPVELVKIENEFFFQEGWEIFVRDNRLEMGDFLVFKYVGYCVFSVTLFGQNGCEREGVGYPKFHHKDTEKENEKNVKHDYSEDEEKENDNEGEKELQDEPFEGGTSGSKSKGSPRAKRKCCRQSQCGHRRPKAVKVKDKYVAQLFDSGVLPRPKNPYFVTKVKRGRQNDLYIPFEFWNNLPDKAILRDPNGREWPVELKWWADGRPWYHKGWGSLCRVNLVKATDRFVCELIRGMGGNEGLTIQVTIIRADEDDRIESVGQKTVGT